MIGAIVKNVTVVAALALVSLACSDGGAQAADKSVKIELAPVPERYSKPLPHRAEAMQQWYSASSGYPPIRHSVDTLLSGDPDFLARLAQASALVPPNERDLWAKIWDETFRYRQPTPKFCDAARGAMAGDASTIRLALAGTFARDCAKEDDRALILRADTPAKAVLDYFDAAFDEPEGKAVPRFDDRLALAAEEVILNEDAFDARRAAFILVQQEDLKGEAALMKIHARMAPSPKKDEVAMAFLRAKGADARKRGEEACKHRPTDAVCSNRNDNQIFEAEPASEPAAVSRSAIISTIAKLRNAGFERVGTVDPATVDMDSAELVLAEAGYLHSFDVETGMFPNEHDGLMRDLAHLVSPAFDGAIFEEIPPRIDEQDVEHGPYILRVYVGGKKYETQADNLEDWYDVDAVLRLMNAVLADRKSSEFLLPLPTGDQTLNILGGPKIAIEQMLKAGIIKAGDPKNAENVGKAFEEEVLKSIREGRSN